MTIVYDTLNSLRRFKDWNPLALRDPRMQWQSSGPDTRRRRARRLQLADKHARQGQLGDHRERARQAHRVRDRQSQPRPATRRTAFTLKPTGRNNRNVEITQTYDVDYGWNLIGRYSGLYIRNVGDDIKLGLGKLTNMLAGVPNYDYNAELRARTTRPRRRSSSNCRPRTCCSRRPRSSATTTRSSRR